MEENVFYKQLIHRYVTGEATEEELEAFFHLLGSNDMDEVLRAYMDQELAVMAEEETAVPVKVRRLWPRIAAAASILLVLAGVAYFLSNKLTKTDNSPLTAHHDVAPGHSQATLTLADGSRIVLKKGLKGKLAQQGNTAIEADAQAITYQEGAKDAKVAYNTLSTKKGEASPYPLVLPDGSKVWLNAASSVTFPTAFNSKTREVKVTGEALFEVAHRSGQPFLVRAGSQTIEDIGTVFDVNAYADEPVAKTTLVEGSVRVNGQLVLKPGEQSELSDGRLVVSKVDVSDVIAWRDGNFRFNGVKLGDILRQASRWYDVEVVYADEDLKNKKFGAIATRFGKVSQLLHALEVTGVVRFKVEGRKITVLNK